MQRIRHNFSTKQGRIDAIIWECRNNGLVLHTQIAYVLATAQHETNGTYRAVKEAYWLDEGWRKRNLRYYPYYGRGLVQLTWKDNYQKYSDILGVDLVKVPSIVMRDNVSLFLLVHGFKYGTFTSKKLENYVNENKTDYINARACINGKDRAEHICTLAHKHLNKL